MANQSVTTDDPPPAVMIREDLHPDDARLQGIGPSGEYPDGRFVSYVYRLLGIDRVRSPLPNGDRRLAIYVYAPELAKAA
jgi:hypothetical protein